MSIVAAWDLAAPPTTSSTTQQPQQSQSSSSSSVPILCSPRSICLTTTPSDYSTSSTSTNPFDTAATTSSSGGGSTSDVTNNPSTVAVVYGTDVGTLHYRTFASHHLYHHQYHRGGLLSSGGGLMSSNTASTTAATSPSTVQQQQQLQLPLGVTTKTTRPSPQLPRWYYPVDLKTSLSGSIVACIPLRDSSTTHNLHHHHASSSGISSSSSRGSSSQHYPYHHAFLLLVDDNNQNRGGSSSSISANSAQAGAYAAHVVSLAGTAFHVLSSSSSSSLLPRMSCAVVVPHSDCLVYAAGRSIGVIPIAHLVDSFGSIEQQQGGSAGIAGGSNSALRKQQQMMQQQQQQQRRVNKNNETSTAPYRNMILTLPAPGVRSGAHALAVTTTTSVQVAVCAVGNAFYAVNLSSATTNAASSAATDSLSLQQQQLHSYDATTKILSLTQSSQVHPVIVTDLKDESVDTDWACFLIANGRECAIVDIFAVAGAASGSSAASPSLPSSSSSLTPLTRIRGSLVTVASPILAAASASWPWVALLTSDGLVSIRSPSCLAIVLRQVEVGRPNDYFELLWLNNNNKSNPYSSSHHVTATTLASSTSSAEVAPPPPLLQRQTTSAIRSNNSVVVAASYSGEGKVILCPPDSAQDLADRLMRLAIDAFGANGFPRSETAEALGASFSSSSSSSALNYYPHHPEASPLARSLLQQYLEAVLGLTDWESGAASGCWPTERGAASADGTTGGVGVGVGHYHGTFGGSSSVGSPTATVQRGRPNTQQHHALSGRGEALSVVSAATPASLLTGTALLCLVCMQLTPPNSSLANRAAKACSEKVGVIVLDYHHTSSYSKQQQQKEDGDDDLIGAHSTTDFDDRAAATSSTASAAASVCELVVEKLLREASSLVSLLKSGSSSAPTPMLAHQHHNQRVNYRTSQAVLYTEFVESCVWLLRACGKHERAIEVAYERLQRQQHHAFDATSTTTATSSAAAGGSGGGVTGSSSNSNVSTNSSSSGSGSTRGVWSQIKYESYTATHLSELWATGTEAGCQLVLQSSATHRLLESNPRLGLSVFCSVHPQESQWRSTRARDDPLANPDLVQQVVKLLKSIHPSLPYTSAGEQVATDKQTLPLDSGRALAVYYLESAIGIDTGRPTEADEFDSLPPDTDIEERIADFHDELALLLLEGVIAERRDDESGDRDTELGSIYRSKLRRLLRWPLAKIRSDHFTSALPPSFLQEKALILGRLGRHEDALRILYRDLNSLDLALEYCDIRHEQLKSQQDRARARQQQHGMFEDYQIFEPAKEEDNAYLPLVRVALDSEDTERGTAAAIQVLALRRSAIDRAAALRLLPSDVPVSAVARPFLIPALVDSESQVRRLVVVSSLLRARYLRLKDQLTTAQLRAQANLHVVPQLRSLHLGDPLHSTNPFRARTSSQASSAMPDVMIVKHFFPRHLVIQAKVTNSVGLNAKYARTLSDIAFVVAESSEEAIQPLMQVPIHVLPPKMTGCAWCVLSASPARMDGPTGQLTCELRYTVQSVEMSSGMAIPAIMSPGAVSGRTYVEELQDLEVHASHFS